MSGEGFAYFRYNTIKMQLFGPETVDHGWGCTWCREAWLWRQRHRL